MKKEIAAPTSQPSVTAPPIAIVGIGCIFPQAADTAAFWTNIKSGRDAITEVPASHWSTVDYFNPDPKSPDQVYAKHGGFISPVDFNPMEYGILPNALEAIDTSQLLGLVAVEQALKDAGYTTEKSFDRERVSVIIGVTGTLELVIPLGARLGHPRWREALRDAGIADAIAEDAMQRIADSYVPWQENSFPGLLGNVVAGRISKHFNFGGTNCVCDAACGSSLSALNLAVLELAAGKSDMVVTGGIDTFNDIFMYTCFSKTPALSPSGHARPFDSEADGTTLGEGLGIVVLKRLADAERDGDKIYAVIRGIGTSSDGKGSAIYEPSAAGQEKALRRAYEQSAISPETIELIEAHGTGTKVGDAVEVKALRQVFGEASEPWCALGSVKSQIGHTKAAAGAAGLIKATLALYHKTLPPTIKVKQPQETVVGGASPFYINTSARPWLPRAAHPRRAGVSALGFGGSNFHCLLEEYRPLKAAPDGGGEVQILAFSAADPAGLTARLQAFPATAPWQEVRRAAIESCRSFDATQPCRLLLVCEEEKQNLAAQLKSALALAQNPGKETFRSTPDGVYLATGPASGRLGLLFPGQGAQYPGMLGDLALRYPQMLDTLQAADAAFAAAGGVGRLSDCIYPRPGFTAAQNQLAVERLQATEVAQPALGTVSLGALKILTAFGLTAEACAGHSYGELTALCAAGVIDEPTLHRLSRLRGTLMAAGEGDRGTMLAVSAPLATVEALIAEEQLDLVLANRNTPTQGVLSGATVEIERAARLLKERSLSGKQLTVAAAFHSKLVAPAATPFAAALQDVSFQSSTMAVYANTTGQTYPQDGTAARELLARQLASPVDFVAEIEAMYAAGVRIFVEVGPGARLTGMVKAILGERDYQALALDASNGKRSGVTDLARLLAQLAALGEKIELARWDEDPAAQVVPAKKKGMTVPLSGINYFNRPAKRPPVEKAEEVKSMGPIGPMSPMSPMGPMNNTPVAPQPAALQEALQLTRQSMQALQELQEQTSRLHQQFLSGQENATRSFLALIEQQRQLLIGGSAAPLVSLPTVAPLAPPVLAVPVVSAPLAPVVTPVPVAVAVATPSVGREQIARVLLAVVAEKTGYPPEMLELGMTLDADLGIDSIKRVEILSALQEQLPDCPAVRPEDLGVLQTLGQIVEHLAAAAGSVVPSAPAAPAPVAAAAIDAGIVAQTLLAVVAEKTGYPPEMLELGMTLDADLGIDSIKRVEILSALQERLPDCPAVRPEDLGVLQTLGQIVAHLAAASGATALAAPAVATPAAGMDRDAVARTLLTVVAEKTGYPLDMLELEMALDADLGIDSIKRVEILSALQERLPGCPAVRPEDLGVLQTLGQIVAHLAAASAPQAAPAPAALRTTGVDRQTVASTLLAVIAEKTGYPVEMLELEMALDADLGIDSIKRVEILSALQERLPAAPAIRPEHLGTLQTVGQIVDFLASVSGAVTATPAALPVADVALSSLGIERKVLKVVPLSATVRRESLTLASGVVWISADGAGLAEELATQLAARQLQARVITAAELATLTAPPQLAGLILLTPSAGMDDRALLDAFRLLQLAAPGLLASAAAGSALFATISRLNGAFGLLPGEAPLDPLSGGLAGLAKTASHEWPQVHCKALDLAADLGALPAVAGQIVSELLLDGPLEVGISPQGLHTLKLSEIPLGDEAAALPLARGEVVVISGGARGVTAEAAIALAASCQATLLLLGRSAAPETEPEWLAGLSVEAEIKKALIAHADTPLKPKELEVRYTALLGNREIAANLRRIEENGGRAIYASVDLRDPAGVKAVVDRVRSKYGPIRGLIHGAGVLADRLIKDKTVAQFEEVYSTKIVGLRSLLAAVQDDALRFVALFSSSTGRFGRTGQVDYAVANEVLNKLAQEQARLRPECRVVSLNWGPWDGGMVTPALKKLFEQEGILTIDLRSGADYLLQELAAPPAGSPVELVILGSRNEEHLDSQPQSHQNIYVSKAFDLDLSIEHFPFLRSHVIDQKAVLPMAMIIEWMAHGAIHSNPGLRFHGFNDLRILKGVTLEPGQSHSLQVMTGKAIKSNGFHVVPVELSGVGVDGRPAVHCRARIVLASRLPERKAALAAPELSPYPRANEEIYRPDRLFHGADFHGIREVIGVSNDGIASLVRPAPAPSAWIEHPLRNRWLADPLVLDSSFQMMILWSFERYRAGSLPVFAGRYRQYSEAFPASGAEIRIRILRQNAGKATAEIDFVDPTTGQLIARLEDYECVIDASLNESFARNTLQGVAQA